MKVNFEVYRSLLCVIGAIMRDGFIMRPVSFTSARLVMCGGGVDVRGVGGCGMV